MSYSDEDIEWFIGRKAYKKSRGLFGYLIGTIKRSESDLGISPLVLETGGMVIGVRPEDLVIVEDEDVEM